MRANRVDAGQMVRGIWRDDVYRRGPSGEDVRVSAGRRRCNLIVQPSTYLLAGLLRQDPVFLGGILWHAIGEGDAAWDTLPTDPTKFDETLFNEVYRQAPDGIGYLKAGFGKALGGSTTTIADPSRVESGALVGRSEPDGFFTAMTVNITAGTNVGLSRLVSAYVQSSGTMVVAPAFPVAIDATSEYEFTPAPSATVTNVIEVKTTVDYGLVTDPFNNIYWREQGLFGGTATALGDSGLMLNAVRHARFWKNTSVKVVRTFDIHLRV